MPSILLNQPDDILFLILEITIAEDIHSICAPESPESPFPSRTMLAVLPSVCRTLRTLSRKTFSEAFEEDLNSPDKDSLLRSIHQALRFLWTIAPVHQSSYEQGTIDTIGNLASSKDAIVPNCNLKQLRGLLGIYCKISVTHVKCYSIVKTSSVSRAVGRKTLEQVMGPAIVEAYKEQNRFIKTYSKTTRVALEYRRSYSLVHDIVYLYLRYVKVLLTVVGKNANEIQMIYSALDQLDNSTDMLSLVETRTPEFLREVMKATKFVSLLEIFGAKKDGSWSTVQPLAEKLYKSWHPFVN
ncbi:hypothetical protein BU17DRAFT_101131 [Hysterangium stoloniferum]|nr:hypothetical protein BU17DRAFT_101128 [Hysterangium stoloniferum]KAF8505202.1 hypothetical protein BU17DRAFT_101131 [Hysterangium stoloniferum]